MIESSEEEAKSHNEEIEKTLAEYNKRVSEARSEGFAFRRGLKEDALEKERDLIANTRGEAARMLAEAQAELERTVEEGKRTLSSESKRMAIDIANAVISTRGIR